MSGPSWPSSRHPPRPRCWAATPSTPSTPRSAAPSVTAALPATARPPRPAGTGDRSPRTPTGRVDHLKEHAVLVLTRTFRAPVQDVWDAVTEPERLARWIGTFTGDPATGQVMFQMTAEDGAPPEKMEIRE